MADTSSARSRYAELRQSMAATDDQLHELVELCQQLDVPKVTMYVPVDESWWRMYTGYAFTEREDADRFVWIYSPYLGELHICGPGPQQSCRFEEWDEKAQFFTDASFDEGVTNMHPFERERRYGSTS